MLKWSGDQRLSGSKDTNFSQREWSHPSRPFECGHHLIQMLQVITWNVLHPNFSSLFSFSKHEVQKFHCGFLFKWHKELSRRTWEVCLWYPLIITPNTCDTGVFVDIVSMCESFPERNLKQRFLLQLAVENRSLGGITWWKKLFWLKYYRYQ